MLAPLPTEVVTTDAETFYCECSNTKCTKHIALPPNVAAMLMEENNYLVVIAEGCAWHVGQVVAEGDGFKVYRFK